MSKGDDLFGKKKENIPVLDLSKTITYSREELKRVLEKVPDFKMRPIKIRSDETKIKEKGWIFSRSHRLRKRLQRRGSFGQSAAGAGCVSGEHQTAGYADPIPTEMKTVVMNDICTVPIDWKMLTTLRPKTSIEEQYFSKLIELGKLQARRQNRDQRSYELANHCRRVKNRSGIIESRITTCIECLQEFCTSQFCIEFNYDQSCRLVHHAKPTVVVAPQAAAAAAATSAAQNRGVAKPGGTNSKLKTNRHGGQKSLTKRRTVSRKKVEIRKK